MRISKLFPRKVGTIALASVTAICAGTVMMIPGIAGATVTLTSLTTQSFATTTVPTGQWMLPTTVPANQGCLTAGTSAAPTSIPECTPTTDTSGNGALQLTTNSNTEVGTVFNTTSLPSNQGLDVSFNTYQFDPATPPPGGADGISFALVASNPANPQPPASGGPSGGSLGYSTNQSAAGIPDGYLGFGLDVFGNFLNTTSGGTSCPADGSIGNSTYPQSVTVRGPGDGGTGYCVVATTASTSSPSSTNNLPGGTGTLDSTSATTHSSSVPVEIALNPSSSTATTASGLSVPAGDFLVVFTPISGSRQTLSGTLPSLIGNTLGIPSTWYNGTTGIPYQLTFGWSASTGSHNEFHEISTLTSSTLNGPLPKLQLTDADNSSGVLMQGASSSDMVLTPSLGSSAAETNPPTVTDTFPAGVVPGTPSGTNWGCSASSGQTISCLYSGGTVAASGTYPSIVVPLTVTGSAAVGAGSDSAKVSSIDALPATAADAFTVELYPSAPTVSSVTSGDTGATVTFTAPSNGGSAITGYTITPYKAGVAQTPQIFNSTATTEAVTGLTPGVSYAYTVEATNAVGTGTASVLSAAVVALANPSVTSLTLPGGEVGVHYSQTVAGSGGTQPESWAVTTGVLPGGLVLNSASGTISGTPSTAGTPTFSITLTDSSSNTAVQSYNVTIATDPLASTVSPVGGLVGVPYSQTLAGTGGTIPYTWTLTAGTLPAGLSLAGATGVISGTPSAVGDPTFSITLSDADAMTSTQSYTLAVLASSLNSKPIADTPNGGGYWVVNGSGVVTPFGNATLYGSLAGQTLNKPIIGISATPDGKGYWLVASDGGIFAFGDAVFYGSTGGVKLAAPVVGMTTTPNGDGYWLVASDGGVFAFGNAAFHGSMGGQHLNKPVVGISIAAGGSGYWLVASDGGIFAFGDAFFYGSMGGQHLAEPVVGMAAIPSGTGYWLVASDGGVFTYGAAVFYGSHAYGQLNQPMTGIDPTPNGLGYWLVAADGGVFTYGDAVFYGSTPSI